MRLLRLGTQVLGELMITAGALLLLFVGWQLWWTDVTAGRQQADTVTSLEQTFQHPTGTGSGTATSGTGGSVLDVGRLKPGQPFAIVRIPRFGRSYARPVLEGTGYSVLQQGFGHYLGTASPGRIGNFAIAGHRTTYGKPLNQIATLRRGDDVVVEVRGGYLVYAVSSHLIVRPTEVDVVDAVPRRPNQTPTLAQLTLTSCHPEYSARERYIVFARLLRAIPRAQGLPASYLATPKGG